MTRSACTTRLALATMLCAAGLALQTGPLLSQVSDGHDFERLEASQFGPYRPEQSPDRAAVARRIVEQTNRFRKEQEAAPLAVNEELAETAQAFAEYMARTDRYGHTADGKRPAERAEAQGYEYCLVLENIAYQFRTRGFASKELADALTRGWKDSPGHRKNMLDPDVTETGVAVAHSDQTGVFYAVQLFGRPESQAIEFQIVNETGDTVEYRLGERQFSLAPRYRRTHRLCRPQELVSSMQANDGEEDAASVAPRGGERFVFTTGAGGGVELEKQAADTNGEP
jgi:uncharacterized protein YkwD